MTPIGPSRQNKIKIKISIILGIGILCALHIPIVYNIYMRQRGITSQHLYIHVGNAILYVLHIFHHLTTKY